ncbi:MAG: hypothetical protein QXP80_06685 [Zestosphaera sp.]
MGLERIEEELLSKIAEISEACRDFCKAGLCEGVPRLREGILYEGYDYCLLKTYIDALKTPTFTLITKDEKYVEYVVLSDYVVEVGDEFIQFIHVSNFQEYLKDLAEFNVVGSGVADELVRWVSGLRSK